jgi:hypothetical protein
VFEYVVDNVDEGVWVLNEDLNLNLLYGLSAENNKVSEQLMEFIIIQDW